VPTALNQRSGGKQNGVGAMSGSLMQRRKGGGVWRWGAPCGRVGEGPSRSPRRQEIGTDIGRPK
jgi:hypothetical protein